MILIVTIEGLSKISKGDYTNKQHKSKPNNKIKMRFQCGKPGDFEKNPQRCIVNQREELYGFFNLQALE